MMRYSEKTRILLSADTLNEPKQIRFDESFEDVDVLTLKESVLRQEEFPIGTHIISLGNIALAKLLIIKPTNDLEILVNGSVTPIKCLAGKHTKLWAEVTSLSIVVSTAAQGVLVLLAGE